MSLTASAFYLIYNLCNHAIPITRVINYSPFPVLWFDNFVPKQAEILLMSVHYHYMSKLEAITSIDMHY